MAKKTKKELEQELENSIKEVKIDADEKGFGIDFAESFEKEEEIKNPKIKLLRRARIGDSIRAIELARTHYETDSPSDMALMVAKLSILCTFNGEMWTLHQISRECTTDFLQSASLIYMKHLI